MGSNEHLFSHTSTPKCNFVSYIRSYAHHIPTIVGYKFPLSLLMPYFTNHLTSPLYPLINIYICLVIYICISPNEQYDTNIPAHTFHALPSSEITALCFCQGSRFQLASLVARRGFVDGWVSQNGTMRTSKNVSQQPAWVYTGFIIITGSH